MEQVRNINNRIAAGAGDPRFKTGAKKRSGAAAPAAPNPELDRQDPNLDNRPLLRTTDNRSRPTETDLVGVFNPYVPAKGSPRKFADWRTSMPDDDEPMGTGVIVSIPAIEEEVLIPDRWLFSDHPLMQRFSAAPRRATVGEARLWGYNPDGLARGATATVPFKLPADLYAAGPDVLFRGSAEDLVLPTASQAEGDQLTSPWTKGSMRFKATPSRGGDEVDVEARWGPKAPTQQPGRGKPLGAAELVFTEASGVIGEAEITASSGVDGKVSLDAVGTLTTATGVEAYKASLDDVHGTINGLVQAIHQVSKGDSGALTTLSRFGHSLRCSKLTPAEVVERCWSNDGTLARFLNMPSAPMHVVELIPGPDGESALKVTTGAALAEPRVQLAAALDFTNESYRGLTGLKQAQLKPGCFSLLAHSFPKGETESKQKKIVWLVAGSLHPEASMLNLTGCLKQPYARALLKMNGVIPGYPYATATVCEEGTPGSTPVPCVKHESGNTAILCLRVHPTPQLELRNRAWKEILKMAVLKGREASAAHEATIHSTTVAVNEHRRLESVRADANASELVERKRPTVIPHSNY